MVFVDCWIDLDDNESDRNPDLNIELRSLDPCADPGFFGLGTTAGRFWAKSRASLYARVVRWTLVVVPPNCRRWTWISPKPDDVLPLTVVLIIHALLDPALGIW